MRSFYSQFLQGRSLEGAYPCRATLTFVTRKIAPAAAIKTAATKHDLAYYYG